jgi:lysine biosynthesis protein LysW
VELGIVTADLLNWPAVMIVPAIGMRSGTTMITRHRVEQHTENWLRVPKTRCPNCDAVIKVDRPREGVIIVCPGCTVQLEVVSADPFEIDFTEDWQEE